MLQNFFSLIFFSLCSFTSCHQFPLFLFTSLPSLPPLAFIHTCTQTPLLILQISSVLGADAWLLHPVRVPCLWVRSRGDSLRTPTVFGPQSPQTAPLPSGLSPGDLSPPGSLAHPQPCYTAGKIPVEQHRLGTLGSGLHHYHSYYFLSGLFRRSVFMRFNSA